MPSGAVFGFGQALVQPVAGCPVTVLARADHLVRAGERGLHRKRHVRTDLFGERDRGSTRATGLGQAVDEAEALGALRGQELAGEQQFAATFGGSCRTLRKVPP